MTEPTAESVAREIVQKLWNNEWPASEDTWIEAISKALRQREAAEREVLTKLIDDRREPYHEDEDYIAGIMRGLEIAAELIRSRDST